MAWQIKGQLIEGCSCNLFCPCWFGVKELMVMDRGWCAGAFAFRLRDGNSDGVGLGGRTVVVGVDFPGPTLFDGNGTARVYIDDGADERQREELEAIYTGKRGGPMAIVDSLVSTWLPTRTARIDVSDQGDVIKLTVGDAGTVVSNLLMDGDGHGFTLQGGGFVHALGMEKAELAPTSNRWTDPDMRQYETKSGARGDFSWSA